MLCPLAILCLLVRATPSSSTNNACGWVAQSLSIGLTEMDGLTLLKRDHDSLRILFSLFRGTVPLVFCSLRSETQW
jgi:hypothetical protein